MTKEHEEAPQGWQRDGLLLYTAQPFTDPAGRRTWCNRITVRIDGHFGYVDRAELDALTERLYAFLATPSASLLAIEEGEAAARPAGRPELDMAEFTEALFNWVDEDLGVDREENDNESASAAGFLLDLGKYGMSVVPNEWLRDLEAQAAAALPSRDAAPAEPQSVWDAINKAKEHFAVVAPGYEHYVPLADIGTAFAGYSVWARRALRAASLRGGARWNSLPADFQAVLHLSMSATTLMQLVDVLDHLPKSMGRKMSADAEEAMFNARNQAISLSGRIQPVIDKLNEEATQAMEGATND